jgi:Domain of unknown function (DUF4159)
MSARFRVPVGWGAPPDGEPALGWGGGGGVPLMKLAFNVDEGCTVDTITSRQLQQLTRSSVNAQRPTAWVVWLLIAVAMVATIGKTVPAAELDVATVNRSLNRGVEFLRRTQNERGGWDEFGGQSCGLTALCTLALLNCGLTRDDPTIVKAMQYLRSREANETYSVSLQTLVYCQLGAFGDLPRVRRNVEWLVADQMANGAWNYGQGRGGGDPSNAQFAILALGAAEDIGVKVDPKVFQKSLDYWLPLQDASGSWKYMTGRRPSGSMTCAGISSVLIARSKLTAGAASIRGDQIVCCGGDADKDPVQMGLNWLGENFSTVVNPGGESQTVYYYLYALERVGRLSGQRFIGQYDWYREGASRLIENQDEFLGFWRSESPLEPTSVATSFALLFLAKGKRQVVVGRLQYSDDEKWRRHPQAIAPLVRQIERDWARDLTWQTVTLKQAAVVDLLQAPVIVITGNGPLGISPQESKVLGEYVLQGGTIVFDADAGMGCGPDTAFRQDADRLCREWFDGVGLQRLPPEHPVWSAQRKVDIKRIAEDQWIEGVDACCRTSVFYSPSSLSCRWTLGDTLNRQTDEIPPAAKTNIQNAISIGENIIAYATGRELQEKLESRLVIEGAVPSAIDRGAIRIASLAMDAGGSGAARAVPNATRLIVDSLPIPVSTTEMPVGFDAEALKDVMFLWIHGRESFEFTPEQRETLQTYIENDGIILGSSICGSEAFAESFRKEMSKLNVIGKLETLPTDHAVMRVPGGFDLSQVTIRSPGKADQGRGGGAMQTNKGFPLMEAARKDSLISVFFSPLDLSCALESPNSVQCPGYPSEDAAKIVANWVLYGLNQ